MRTLDKIDVNGKIVLVRVDYNVPLGMVEGEMRVASDFRVRASLPTIQYLLAQGARKVILISHLGRPEGREETLSLRPVYRALQELLPAERVEFVEQMTGPEVSKAVDELPDGGVLLLENLRFDAREQTNSREFAEEIIRDTGAEVFVQDGFAVLHRKQASTDMLARLLPSVAGLLVEKEVEGLEILRQPERPFVVVIGGAKVADKAPLIEEFRGRADKILIGGKIAADGYQAKEAAGAEIVVAEDFDEDAAGVKLDIGPLAAGEFIEQLKGAKTVLWNGVLGKVEDPAFTTSSELIAKFLGERPEIKTVIAGGDTAGFVQQLLEVEPGLSYTLISTGGGATLTLLTGGEMPGLKVLGN